VKLGPSTPGDYVRARVLVPRNPGVTSMLPKAEAAHRGRDGCAQGAEGPRARGPEAARRGPGPRQGEQWGRAARGRGRRRGGRGPRRRGSSGPPRRGAGAAAGEGGGAAREGLGAAAPRGGGVRGAPPRGVRAAAPRGPPLGPKAAGAAREGLQGARA
jgi:hypothetical protein